MKVGDILVYTHHYNARYPEFVRIIRATDKTVWLEHIGKKWLTHDGYGQNGQRIPDFDAPTSPMKGSFRIKNAHGREFIKVTSYCYGYLWDGNPEEEYTD